MKKIDRRNQLDLSLVQDHGKSSRRREKKLLLLQKLMGLVSIAVGIASVPLVDMDATAAIIMVPLGLVLLFTSHIYLDV